VRLAAANALLRSPIPVDSALRGKIVEVLRTAAAADPGGPANAKGQVLIADPNKQRAESSAVLLNAMGYDVEVVTSGRDLFRRVARSSDFDMILVDHHIVNPELSDVLAHLRADLNAGRRPVLVVASADKPRRPSFQMLLLRLALLIAATESDPVLIPPPFNPDPSAPYNIQTREVLPGMPPEMLAAARKTSATRRDGVFATVTATRIARLLRVVETSGVVPTPRQQFLLQLRAEQITLAVLGAEYPMSPESAPRTYERFVSVQNQIALQGPIPPYEGVGLEELMTRIERLEVDVARVPELQRKYDTLRLRVDPETLGLMVRSTRDPLVEAKVSQVIRGFTGVRMIPEPYSRVGFEDDLRAAFADDPAAAPRDPAEKTAGAKMAIEWLRRMAVGEVPGFNITTDRATEKVLRDAMRVDDRAEPANTAVARFPSAEAQQDLLTLSLNQTRPLPLRLQAADATIRHIQVNGKLTPQVTVMELGNRAASEPNAELRGKMLVIKNLLSPGPTDFVPNLLNYRPPLAPVPKVAPPDPKTDPKTDPKADPKAKAPGMGIPPKP
jgi:CheY-like chemotaxis protein